MKTKNNLISRITLGSGLAVAMAVAAGLPGTAAEKTSKETNEYTQSVARELTAMLEENLERTFSADPFHQMGGYVERRLGLTAYIKIENPPGTRIQKLLVGDEEVQPDKICRAAYLSAQAVAANNGRNRHDLLQPTHEAMLTYLAKHKPASAELRGTVVAT